MALVCGAFLVAAASGTSNSNSTATSDPQYGSNSPPPPQQMDATRALGLWKSTFGGVKIESDDRNGGVAAGAVQGVWTYPRGQQNVDGIFWGQLRGNVLEFHWQEPANPMAAGGQPALSGTGYLVFDLQGRQYSGRWRSDDGKRAGDWNGWRPGGEGQGQYASPQPYPAQQGGQGQPYPAQGYPQQGQGYPQQGQGYPQPYPAQQQYPQQYPQQQYPQPPAQQPPQQYPQQPPQQYPQQPPQQYPQQPPQQYPQQPPQAYPPQGQQPAPQQPPQQYY